MRPIKTVSGMATSSFRGAIYSFLSASRGYSPGIYTNWVRKLEDELTLGLNFFPSTRNLKHSTISDQKIMKPVAQSSSKHIINSGQNLSKIANKVVKPANARMPHTLFMNPNARYKLLNSPQKTVAEVLRDLGKHGTHPSLQCRWPNHLNDQRPLLSKTLKKATSLGTSSQKRNSTLHNLSFNRPMTFSTKWWEEQEKVIHTTRFEPKSSPWSKPRSVPGEGCVQAGQKRKESHDWDVDNLEWGDGYPQARYIRPAKAPRCSGYQTTTMHNLIGLETGGRPVGMLKFAQPYGDWQQEPLSSDARRLKSRELTKSRRAGHKAALRSGRPSSAASVTAALDMLFVKGWVVSRQQQVEPKLDAQQQSESQPVVEERIAQTQPVDPPCEADQAPSIPPQTSSVPPPIKVIKPQPKKQSALVTVQSKQVVPDTCSDRPDIPSEVAAESSTSKGMHAGDTAPSKSTTQSTQARDSVRVSSQRTCGISRKSASSDIHARSRFSRNSVTSGTAALASSESPMNAAISAQSCGERRQASLRTPQRSYVSSAASAIRSGLTSFSTSVSSAVLYTANVLSPGRSATWKSIVEPATVDSSRIIMRKAITSDARPKVAITGALQDVSISTPKKGRRTSRHHWAVSPSSTPQLGEASASAR